MSAVIMKHFYRLLCIVEKVITYCIKKNESHHIHCSGNRFIIIYVSEKIQNAIQHEPIYNNIAPSSVQLRNVWSNKCTHIYNTHTYIYIYIYKYIYTYKVL